MRNVPAVLVLWACSLAVGALAGPETEAVRSLQLKGRPCSSPADCTVALVKVATLSEGGHPNTIPGATPYIVEDGRGSFYLGTAQAHVAVFDKGGRLSTFIGKPGEFGRIAVIFAGPNGNVFVYNVLAKQLRSVTSPPTDATAPIVIEHPPALFRDDGTVVVTQQIRTPELIGHPLHLLARDGRLIRSFGADIPEYRADLRLFMERVVAPSADGSLWAVPRGRYAVERWNVANGSLITQFPVRSSWFVESKAAPRDNQTRPTGVIQALWEKDDYLWVLVRDADPGWKPSGSAAERPWELGLVNSSYDWVLEAIDIKTGVVLASRRFDEALYGRAPQLLLASHSATPAGQPRTLNVWRPELQRKGK